MASEEADTEKAPKSFSISVDLPPAGSGIQANLQFKPILSVPSELVLVRYKIPFSLDVVPKKNLAVCTKASSTPTVDGQPGEQVNDVLRYTSQWSLGLPQNADSLSSTAAAFSGGLSWQCSFFDVMSAKSWEQVVNALVSNTPERTDEVVLIFERAIDGTAPELA